MPGRGSQWLRPGSPRPASLEGHFRTIPASPVVTSPKHPAPDGRFSGFSLSLGVAGTRLPTCSRTPTAPGRGAQKGAGCWTTARFPSGQSRLQRHNSSQGRWPAQVAPRCISIRRPTRVTEPRRSGRGAGKLSCTGIAAHLPRMGGALASRQPPVVGYPRATFSLTL
jgi:hypothetical protein